MQRDHLVSCYTNRTWFFAHDQSFRDQKQNSDDNREIGLVNATPSSRLWTPLHRWKIMSKLRGDVRGHVLPRQIHTAFPNLGPIDTWLYGPPMLVTTSLNTVNQFTIAHSLQKFATLREYMKSMAGRMDLTTL